MVFFIYDFYNIFSTKRLKQLFAITNFIKLLTPPYILVVFSIGILLFYVFIKCFSSINDRRGDKCITQELGESDGFSQSVYFQKLVIDGGFIVQSPSKIGSILVANLAGPVNYFFVCSSLCDQPLSPQSANRSDKLINQIMSYTLYGFAMSSCTQRVRSVLNYKKIPYTQVSIDFTKKQQLSEEYSKIHPRQVIPALITPEGHNLIESVTIAEYLEAVHPEKPILPQNKIQRAQVRAITEYINASIQPFQHLGIQQYINTHGEKKIEWKDQWIHWNMLGMGNIEKQITKTRGRFSVGDQLSLADIMIYCQVDSAQTRFGLDFSQYHNVMNIFYNVNNIKEIEQSRGIYQKDFPK